MSEKKKNIIVCLCDQLRASEVGCYGNEVIQTPNMDALAAGGMRFQYGVTNDPLCMPARSTVVSGQYARTCSGQLNNTSILFPGGWMMPPYPEDGRPHLPDKTLPECLREQGYYNAAIGKWHIHSWPHDVGFDEYVIPRTQHCHLGQHYTANGEAEFVPPGYSLDFELDTVGSFLQGRQQEQDEQDEQPFFLFFNISPPHTPFFDIPEEYRTMYDPREMPIRDNCFIDGVMAGNKEVFRTYLFENKHYFYNLPHTKNMPEDFDLRDLYTQYYGATSWVDSAIGRLMQMLRENGLDEDTIVLFTSDHGDNLGSHHRWNKTLMYQESSSVPYIYHVPGVTDGTVAETQMVSHVDIMPTMLDLIGVEAPAHAQGRSVAPVIRGEVDVLPNNYIFIESEIQAVGVRTPQYTFAKRFDRTTRQTSRDKMRLYDIKADPFEMHNLAESNPDHPAIGEWESTLDDWHDNTPWMEREQHIETH